MQAKKVAMGILITLALLSPLTSCSLNSIFSSDQTGEVEISLTIPESLSRSALPAGILEALVPSDFAASRFIHPDTRLIEASIAVNGGDETIRSEATIRSGATSTTITLRRVPMGQHIITLSLYDGGDPPVLLSRGSSSITVTPKQSAKASITAVPITELSFGPGPYSGGFGINIGTEHSFDFLVYRVDLPAAGPYALYFKGNNERPLSGAVIYDSTGKKVALTAAGRGSAGYNSFSAQAGRYYAAVSIPDLGSGNATLAIDADTNPSLDIKSVNIDQALSVMDKLRFFTITIPCGYGPIGGVSTYFAAAEGTVPPVLVAVNSTTILVKPQPNSILSLAYAPSGCALIFIDPMIGQNRTVNFNFPGAPRDFAYCPADYKPADTGSTGYATMRDAVYAFRTNRDNPVIVVQEGASLTETTVTSFGEPMLLIGGCAANGTRTASHGTSAIHLWTFTNALNTSMPNTIFDSLDFQIPGGDLSGSSQYAISLGASTIFRNCAIRGGALSFPANTSYSYSLVFMTGVSTFVFDRCSILGGSHTVNANAVPTLRAVDCADSGATLEVVNSLVDPGEINAPTANGFSYGIHMSQGAPLYLVGSTVSGGVSSHSTANYHAIYCPNASACRIVNSVLVQGKATTSATGDSSILYDSGAIASALPICANSIFSISTIPRIVHYPVYGGSAYTWSAFSGLKPGNSYMNASSLNLTSMIVGEDSFLRSQAASAAALRTGGADLSVAETLTALELDSLDSSIDLRADRLGAVRTGDGATGYTIGAYEVD
jgi:hypothetical protein